MLISQASPCLIVFTSRVQHARVLPAAGRRINALHRHAFRCPMFLCTTKGSKVKQYFCVENSAPSTLNPRLSSDAGVTFHFTLHVYMFSVQPSSTLVYAIFRYTPVVFSFSRPWENLATDEAIDWSNSDAKKASNRLIPSW